MAKKLPIANNSNLEKIISFTPLAEQKTINFIADQAKKEGNDAKNYALRLGVQTGGCNGFSYQIEITQKWGKHDSKYQLAHFKVVIDKKSELFLKGLKIDYINTVMEQRYTFINPNASGSCGCGTSFSI